MRLLNSTTYELRDFIGKELVEYAILSHTWGKDEVIFEDLQSQEYTQKPSWMKIEYCCGQAREDDIEWIWVDTICIDKSSSAELSEAINSMFTWYRDAKMCYAYLSDVSGDPAIRLPRDWHNSRWFSRGWTLQELLAPREMIFYGKDWQLLGTRMELCDIISEVSGIQASGLQGDKNEIGKFSVAQRMCWASRRVTTRSEDIAYCLLGVFGVNMPLLYGEGGVRAFTRLQEEIMKDSDDHTLFAWSDFGERGKEVGLLADHPMRFEYSGDILSFRRWDVSDTFAMTNKGLKITVPMTTRVDSPGTWFAHLDCYHLKHDERCALAIVLKELSRGGDQFARVSRAPLDIPSDLEHEIVEAKKRTIYVRKNIIRPDVAFQGNSRRLREFRLLHTPSTYELIETYGCARQGSTSNALLAPPNTSFYWIEPQTWANWHVVCLYKDKKSTVESKIPDFIVVLGYDTNTAKSWAIIELDDRLPSLRDVWSRVTTGKIATTMKFNQVFWHGTRQRMIVVVASRPVMNEPDVVEVEVFCSKDDSVNRSLKIWGSDPTSMFSGTDDVANVCNHIVLLLKKKQKSIIDIESKWKEDPQPILAKAAKKSIQNVLRSVEIIAVHNKEIPAVFCWKSRSRSAIPYAVWIQTVDVLQSCGDTLRELRKLLRDLVHRGNPRGIALLQVLDLDGQSDESKVLKPSLDSVHLFERIFELLRFIARLYNDLRGRKDAAHIRSLSELSRRLREVDLDIAYMLERNKRYKDGGVTKSSNMLTAINHLKVVIQAANEIVAKYQPLLNEHAAVEEAQEGEVDCDV